jgi:hypothetical protein
MPPPAIVRSPASSPNWGASGMQVTKEQAGALVGAPPQAETPSNEAEKENWASDWEKRIVLVNAPPPPPELDALLPGAPPPLDADALDAPPPLDELAPLDADTLALPLDEVSPPLPPRVPLPVVATVPVHAAASASAAERAADPPTAAVPFVLKAPRRPAYPDRGTPCQPSSSRCRRWSVNQNLMAGDVASC